MGVGQNKTTRNWTAGFCPWFQLPGFHFGYLFLTHSHITSHGRLAVHQSAVGGDLAREGEALLAVQVLFVQGLCRAVPASG